MASRKFHALKYLWHMARNLHHHVTVQKMMNVDDVKRVGNKQGSCNLRI